MPTSERPSYGELADALWELRRDTRPRISADRAARAVGRNQPWLARIERGATTPSVADVEALVALYGVPAATRRRLVQMARDLVDENELPARLTIRRGAEKMQERIARIEQASARIQHFHPILVAGLLQTEAYMRVVFASGEALPAAQRDAALRARLHRRELLDAPGREFVFLLAEGVLRWPLGGPAVMIEQIEYLIDRSHLPQVTLGVISSARPVDVAPVNGFNLYDRRAVVVGTESATAFLTGQHDVAEYVKLFADLLPLAVVGDQARAVLSAVAAEYRAQII